MDKKPTPMDFTTLASRHRTLDNERHAAAAQLKSAQSRLEEAKTKAREQFQTDDIDALRKKLEAMKTENLAKRTAYQALLDDIDTRLKAIDSNFAQASGAKA